MNSTLSFHKRAKGIGLLLGISLLLCFGCDQTASRNENTNAANEQQRKTQLFWRAASSTFQKITLSDSAVVRRVSWNQALNSLQEKIELAEIQPSSGQSYSLYLDESDLNFVDISYQTDAKNQIIKIGFDIYLENKLEADELLAEFDAYFQLKYGSKTISQKKNSWKSEKNNTQIELEDVSTSKDPGIKLMYSYIN
jgi:hypothetical protein